MRRVAIIGGGIAGLAAAYELELERKRGADIDWHLYEASSRLGGIIETTRHTTDMGEFVLEGGPDGWVSEKPWARELAVELGLESALIESKDSTRKTYILIENKLQAMPDGMRMMVPGDLAALEGSPLFTDSGRAAYAAELTRAEELKRTAPDADESVANFVRRHFGDEVLERIGAPLLSGVASCRVTPSAGWAASAATSEDLCRALPAPPPTLPLPPAAQAASSDMSASAAERPPVGLDACAAPFPACLASAGGAAAGAEG